MTDVIQFPSGQAESAASKTRKRRRNATTLPMPDAVSALRDMEPALRIMGRAVMGISAICEAEAKADRSEEVEAFFTLCNVAEVELRKIQQLWNTAWSAAVSSRR